jgi:anti-sigma B factor antagonist
MDVRRELRDGRLVLTPDGALLVAGPAEQFESLLQNVLAEGHRHLIVNLEHVAHMDSGGIRAVVRGYLTAQRLGGVLTLCCADRHVYRLFALMRLDTVFDIFESVQAAVAAPHAVVLQTTGGTPAQRKAL